MSGDQVDLGELLGRAAPRWLRRLEVTAGRVVVELEVEPGAVLGFSRAIAEGDHDVAALVAAVLADGLILAEQARALIGDRT